MVKPLDAVYAKKKMVCSPKKRGVSFDPPLNLNSYIHVVPFPSRLAVAKGTVSKEEVSFLQSSGDASLTRKDKKVWAKALAEEKKEEEVQHEASLGNLLVKHDDPISFL